MIRIAAIISVVFLLANCFAVSAFSKNADANTNIPKTASVMITGLPEPVVNNVNSVNIIVDPRIELIAVIQQISRYSDEMSFLMNKNGSEYRKNVLEHFSSYNGHEAVKMFDEVSLKPRMYNFSAPSTSMLYMTTDFEMRSDVMQNDFLMQRIGGREKFVKFIRLLRDFSERTSFRQFFNENRAYYEKLTSQVKSQMGGIDCIKEIEGFYGQKNKTYNIVLVPLYNYVGYGAYLTYKNGEKDIYNIMGPKDSQAMVFGDAEYFAYMQRHEFSHSYVNPLTEKYWGRLKEYSYLFDGNEFEVAKKRGICGEWQECINEHIIRAITTHLAWLESEKAGKQVYNMENKRGLPYFDELLIRIKQFEKERDRYPTFEAFYPELIKVFQKKP
jgi:hypothetical protein